MSLPPGGRTPADILAELEQLQSGDVDWRGVKVFSLAYDAGDEVYELGKEAAARFSSANALNPFAFPSLGRMQSEVVAAFSALLHGDTDAAGFMTSGGTESILLAVKGARNRGRELGITEPEVVLPTSAHAAFTKGCHDYGLRSVRVPVGADFKADVDAMAAAVNDRTVLLIASAPSYPQGVIDDVAAIAAVAADAGALCHVDACMGGVTLPFLERLGHPIPPFDFRVPGVTSMSVDLHKYGYAPKGASVILHRTKELRKHQTFTTDDWLGGYYASSGILGTKSGAPIAGAWAVLQHLGEAGYLRLTGVARRALEELVAGLRATDGVRVVGEPEATLVAFTCPEVDTFAVGRALFDRGWYADQQAPPPSLHCTVHAGHAGTVGAFVEAVAECIAEVGSSAGEQIPYASLE